MIAVVGWLVLRLRGADEPVRRRGRQTIAVALLVNETIWHLWVWQYVGWTPQTMLPLHVCSVLVWVSAYGLLTRNPTIYEFMYFMGIAGPLQAIITPNAGQYGLPHYRALQTLTAHGLLVIGALYLTVVEGMRPTWHSVRRVILGTLGYLAAVTVVNVLIGSNFAWTMGKPPVVSLLDTLGPWPWYLLPMILLGVVNVVLLYLPFWWLDRRRVRVAATHDRPAA